MKPSEQDQLLKELLAGNELSDLRRASLEQGLAGLAQQRQRRRVLRASMLAALPLALTLGIVFSRPARTSTPVIPANPPPPPAVAGAQTGPPEVKMISDEELLALFPHRAVALIGKPGSQQLVFLDRAPRPDL